jgi:uncharacterized protein YndB with AHSA1/START domain
VTSDLRVELQAEVDAPRLDVFALFATEAGLASWLDAAEMQPKPGSPVRFRLLDAEATGAVVALDPPQHISFSWAWVGEPIGAPTVVAFDAIDHGARTHVTLRHVGFRSRQQLEAHDAMWRHWFGRFCDAAARLPEKVETSHP